MDALFIRGDESCGRRRPSPDIIVVQMARQAEFLLMDLGGGKRIASRFGCRNIILVAGNAVGGTLNSAGESAAVRRSGKILVDVGVASTARGSEICAGVRCMRDGVRIETGVTVNAGEIAVRGSGVDL